MVITVTGPVILCLFFCWAFNQGNQQQAAREAEIKALEFTEEKKKAAQAQREAEARAREAARAAEHQRILAERLKEAGTKESLIKITNADSSLWINPF